MYKKKGLLDNYYKTRLDYIDYIADVEKELAKIRLKGVAGMTMDDYKLLYQIDQGILDYAPDMGPVWDPARTWPHSRYKNDPDNMKKKALFNPRRRHTSVATGFPSNDMFNRVFGQLNTPAEPSLLAAITRGINQGLGANGAFTMDAYEAARR